MVAKDIKIFLNMKNKGSLSLGKSLMKFIEVSCNHGTAIQTRITCKKIPCYVRDSP